MDSREECPLVGYNVGEFVAGVSVGATEPFINGFTLGIATDACDGAIVGANPKGFEILVGGLYAELFEGVKLETIEGLRFEIILGFGESLFVIGGRLGSVDSRVPSDGDENEDEYDCCDVGSAEGCDDGKEVGCADGY